MSPNDLAPSVLDASIHLIAQQLLDQLVAGQLEPSLIHVAPTDDGFDLGIKALDGMHPTPLLLGFLAPDEWHGLGMATAGWAYDPGDRATGRARRRRVHVVTLLTRSGEVVNRVDVPDDPAQAERLTEGNELTGEQVDLLRLSLGLPTPPPPCPTAVYWTIEWLAGVLGDHPDDVRTWADVTARHPALTVLRGAERTTTGVRVTGAPDDDGFHDIATGFASVCTWRRLRLLVCEGRFSVPELTADDARWLDDGSFARFTLSRCPPLSMLRSQARDHLTPALGDRLDRVLDDLGIPGAAWPEQHAA